MSGKCIICDRTFKQTTLDKYGGNLCGRCYNKDKNKTTETFGISLEYAICKAYNIKFPLSLKRVDEDIIFDYDKKFFKYIFGKNKPIEYLGYENEEVDFVLKNGKTLSLKTSYNSDKVCPQKIGQTTRKRFCEYFDIDSKYENNDKYLKKFIINNIHILLVEYLKHLFSCDYILYIKSDDYFVLRKRKKFNIDEELISFTQTYKSWNESNTVKYSNKSIGEFQLHKNRNCIKFRFIFKELYLLIY